MSYETLCRVYRGGILESVHQGTVVVADTEGNIRFSLGDPHMLYFPRSSLKMIQALEFCRSGAYRSLGLSPQHLALCCASHDAEPLHTDMIKDWLGKMNLSADNLACGPAQPNHERTKLDMYKRGEQPTRAHHECSGKHCGFISTAVHQGHDTATYHLPENPVQRKLSENMALMGGPAPGRIFWAVDGCRLPTPAILTEEMAVMTAKFAGTISVFLLVSCGGSDPKPEKQEMPKPPMLPDWVLNPVIEGGFASAECVPATNDMSLDRSQATAQGRAEISRQLGVKTKVMDKTYQNKVTTAGGSVTGNTFEAVSKQVSEQYLQGSRASKVEYVTINGKNNLCVMVTLDPASSKKLFDAIVDGSNRQVSPQDKDVLYQEFKAFKAQEELDQETAK
ncbi:hypothetical protein CHS0354_030100 [Potamilus streckersoni]|uniref:Asparaginase n=1 Tax=Potamilus streckersoni TaxID=2493646 RepID=A0AAE0RL57_9BIVA|nr:hypothetical protein CHS0354_030100 [Potamilus streckersoni]